MRPGARRSSLWQLVASSLSVFSILYGLNYIVQSNKYASNPSLEVLRSLPGHMRTHGVLMLIIGILLYVESIKPYHRGNFHGKPIMIRIFCGYCVFVSITIVGSWHVTKQYALNAPCAWIGFFLVSGALIMRPPPLRSAQSLDGDDVA